jgi:hypothetical protein
MFYKILMRFYPVNEIIELVSVMSTPQFGNKSSQVKDHWSRLHSVSLQDD